jgi:hypothetical protein
MKKLLLSFSPLLLFSSYAAAQAWEIGGSAGYGFPLDVDVTRANITGKTGFKQGVGFGVVAGNQQSRRLGGEVRYLYRDSDLKLSSGGTKVEFPGDSHIVHYDARIHFGNPEGTLKPFVAFGGGVKVYRGTGKESPAQPLSSLAALTRTNELLPLLSIGMGVSKTLGKNLLLRFDFRDYVTPFPKDVIAPHPSASLDGWLHDFTTMVGISFVF